MRINTTMLAAYLTAKAVTYGSYLILATPIFLIINKLVGVYGIIASIPFVWDWVLRPSRNTLIDFITGQSDRVKAK